HTVIYTSPSPPRTSSFPLSTYPTASTTSALSLHDALPIYNTVVRSFTVTVNPVNYAPTLDPISNLTINENSGAQTVNLTGISSEVSNQHHSLTVTAPSSNPSLAPNHTVNYTSPNSTGTLSF